MADQPKLSELAFRLLVLHCAGRAPEADSDDERNRAYEELVRTALMHVSGQVANGDGLMPSYEPTEKGRRWYSVVGTKVRAKRRRRGFWAILRG